MDATNYFLTIIKLMTEGVPKVVADTKSVSTAIGSMNQQLETGKERLMQQWKVGTAGSQELKDKLDGTTDAAKKGTSTFEQMGLAMKRALIVAPVWMLMRGAIQAVTNTISDQIKFLIDMENAMTRIKIVGKGTEEEYTRLQSALVGLAYTYGLSSAEAAKAAVLFAQQGKTVQETIELTRIAMLSAQVLGTDIGTAVNDMTAALEGFQLGVGDATAVVDKWINVEKQFAVTSKDLADATKVAGAAANQLGITMNQFLGDVTAVVEVTRKSGAEAARGLTFLYARLYTTGKDTVEQVAKIPFYLSATGEATNEVSKNLRGQADILEELAGKWNTLTKEERLQIAESLGSKRQLSVVYALMQNYNNSLDARIAALTSAGAAEKAFALTLQTTTTKMQQLGTTWNVLTTTVGDTGAFKVSLDAIKEYMIGIAALIDYKKAYNAVNTETINKEQLSIDTRRSEIKSIEELIDVRNKLAKSPQTAENIARTKTVQDAIDATTKKQPTLRVAIETGDPKQIKIATEQIQEGLDRETLRAKINLEFGGSIVAATKELKEAIRVAEGLPVSEALKGKGGVFGERVVTAQTKLNGLLKKRDESLEKQYRTMLAQSTVSKVNQEAVDEENDSADELTEKTKERLNIERELISVKYSSGDIQEQMIEREIELINSAKILYTEKEKLLKTEELRIRLMDIQNQKQQEQINNLKNMSLQYEKGDMFEKSRIREVAELSFKTPEELTNLEPAQQRMVLDNLSAFSKEQQDAIIKNTELYKEFGDQLQSSIESGQEGWRTFASPENNKPQAMVEVIPQIPATPGISNNNYNIPITLTGAITDEDIKALLNKIDETMKEQPNYIGNKELKDMLNNPEIKNTIADIAGNTNTK